MDLEAELLKSLPKEELESQITERIKSFQGLLTRDVALRLIAKEKGGQAVAWTAATITVK